MKDVMGIIYTSREELSLRELTSKRSVAALPVAARYRLVDFLISSMVNSGIRNVCVPARLLLELLRGQKGPVFP